MLIVRTMIVCWLYVDRMFIVCWLHVDCMLIVCWLYVDCMLIVCWLYVDCMLIVCWLYVDCMLIACWLYVDRVLFVRTLIVYWLYIECLVALKRAFELRLAFGRLVNAAFQTCVWANASTGTLRLVAFERMYRRFGCVWWRSSECLDHFASAFEPAFESSVWVCVWWDTKCTTFIHST